MARRGADKPLGNPVAVALAAALRASKPPEQTKLDVIKSFASDPNGFASTVLGIQLWRGQRDILDAVRDNRETAIVSGHKVGKSTALAVLALWWYCSFPGARVVLTATTDRQVNGIIWREVRRLVRLAGRRGYDIPGAADIHLVASSGLKDPDDFSEILGFTAKEAEAIAGTSGAFLLYLVDEASGVPDLIFEAIQGNMMGGAKIVLISNPTRTSGEFFEAFKNPESGYKCLEISSEETPNCTGLEPAIPGLADPDMIAKFEKRYGRDSVFFKVRVLGKFVIEEEGKAFPLELIAACELAWEANADSEPEGRLVVACDGAGDSGEGDESVLTVRRGVRAIKQEAKRGLDASAHIAWIAALVQANRKPREDKPVIVIDAEGPIGSDLFHKARNAEELADCFVIGVHSGKPTPRQAQVYDTTRDAMLGNLRDLGRAGLLEFAPDAKLERELNAHSFTPTLRGKNGIRFKATPKKEIKALLKRSPDRYDSLALAFWYVDNLQRKPDGTYEAVDNTDDPPLPPTLGNDGEGSRYAATDPYAALADFEAQLDRFQPSR